VFYFSFPKTYRGVLFKGKQITIYISCSRFAHNLDNELPFNNILKEYTYFQKHIKFYFYLYNFKINIKKEENIEDKNLLVPLQVVELTEEKFCSS
jgi:hypothetical protein